MYSIHRALRVSPPALLALAILAFANSPRVALAQSFETPEVPQQAARSAPAQVMLHDARQTAAPARKPANLVEAAGSGNLDAVDALLRSGADVNARAELDRTLRWTTPLIAAADRGFPLTVAKLLAAGADVDAVDGVPRDGVKAGTTALMQASYRGHARVVQALLAAHADVNRRDANGQTALVLAAQAGSLEVVRALLAAKADPDVAPKYNDGRTALLEAMRGGSLDVAMALVQAGANVNAFSDHGVSALRLAALGNTAAHLALVKALLARSADVEAGRQPDYNGQPCAPYVASAPGAAADIAGMMADIKRVRESCEVGKLENAEGTPLGAAVRYGSLEIVQALIAAKANLNARQSQWQTPLMIAMANGRADVARALLDAGADTLLQDNRGRTAAMLAAGN